MASGITPTPSVGRPAEHTDSSAKQGILSLTFLNTLIIRTRQKMIKSKKKKKKKKTIFNSIHHHLFRVLRNTSSIFRGKVPDR